MALTAEQPGMAPSGSMDAHEISFSKIQKYAILFQKLHIKNRTILNVSGKEVVTLIFTTL